MRTTKDIQTGSFLRDSAWSTVTTGATIGFQMLEIIILSRALSQPALGVYFLVTAFPELIQGLLDLRLQEVMIKYLISFIKSGDANRINALIKVTWLVSVAAGGLLLFIVAVTATFASSLLGVDSGRGLMLLYSVGLFSVSLQGRSGAIIRALGRFELNFWVALSVALVRFLVVVAAVSANWGVTGVIAGRVVGQFVSTAIVGTASLLLLRTRVKLDFSVPLSVLRPLWRELAMFSFHLNLASIAKGLTQKLDTILVGAFLNPSAVAAYKVVGQFGRAIYLLSDPLTTAAYPRFVALVSGGKLAEVNSLARRASWLVGLLLAPVLLISTIFSSQLVTLFAGPQYSAHGWLLPLFMWSCAPAVVLFWTHPYLLSIGWAHASAYANLVGRVAGILVLAALLSAYSLAGAAIGSGLPACLTVAAGLWYVRKRSRQGTEPSLDAVKTQEI